ncbi:MAG TPA: hypothetical protein PKV72_04065 [Candidatus Peribacteria bacterium]|nr:hypothetical protein [Candidatus Peribacteria bacterium]
MNTMTTRNDAAEFAVQVDAVEAEYEREGAEGVRATFAGRDDYAAAIRAVLNRAASVSRQHQTAEMVTA